MSFVTGRAQRRGQIAATVGTSFAHVKQTPYPRTDLLRQSAGQFRAPTKRRRTASIGDDAATGLVIHGTHEIDTFEGTDPDGATPPISGATLSNPDFPVSYTGRGTLKFISPIRITTVDGPLRVNGSIYDNQGQVVGIPSEITSWASTLEVGATGGGGANFTKDGANTYATLYRVQDSIFIQLHYTWTSKGSVLDGDAIFIKGLPYTTETQVHKIVIHTTGISASQIGSYFIIDADAGTTELGIFSSDASTASEVTVTGAECAAAGSISFSFNYHGVIP